MRITSVNIPANKKVDGLEGINMSRLGKIVLLAGKNGSGKSRILSKIIHRLSVKPKKSTLESSLNILATYQQHITNAEKGIKEKRAYMTQSADERRLQSLKAEIKSQEKYINDLNAAIEQSKSRLAWNEIDTDLSSDNYSSLQFVPRSSPLSDPAKVSKREMLRFSDLIKDHGVTNLNAGSFAKIQVIQDRFFETSHQMATTDEKTKKDAESDYNELQRLIKVFLNTEITRSSDGIAEIFGLELGNCSLSNGQILLVQYCMAIYSQKDSLTELILFMDEPENHLHPSAIIDVINRLEACVPNGQIWIATHSIHLLSQFDPNDIWFVDGSSIKHAGKIPEKVLESLIGDVTQVGKLQQFISLPSQYATSKYAIECLFDPAVVMTTSSDPQTKQIRERLASIMGKRKLKILDYGIGKGRLIANLKEIDDQNEEKLLDKIDFVGFDAYDDDKEICKSILESIFGTSSQRYYNDIGALLSDHDKESFDVIIMCNVLHEIDPSSWLNLFKKDGELTQLMNADGMLLLIEDQEIPVGEKAHKFGFLVFDTPQLKEIFKISSSETDFKHSNYNGNDRLKAHFIPKKYLERIDNESKIKAIKDLSSTAARKISEIRSKKPDFINGKLHGFWTQQFANAELYLKTQI